MPQTILIVDDDPTQRRLLETVIDRQGFQTRTASGGREAIELLSDPKQNPIDVLLLDLVMPDIDGMKVLEDVRQSHPALPVIMLTAQSGIDTIVKSMRAGANDFIVKPASPERLQVSIENVLKMNALTGEISRLTRKISGEMTFGDLICESPVMRQSLELAERASTSNIPILIEGESGVGKEVVARAIQGSGERAGKPFVAVNCGAIPENLVESLLFGHEKGAFTGASDRHIGKFQEADGGTLFLDEIGELRPDIQVKLLRALQEGEIDPVGGKRPVKVDIRLISATNRNLQQMVQEGKFREDLYYRLSVYPIYVPPLRERPEDLAPLTEHFIASFAATEGKAVKGIQPDATQLLRGYAWPGNVRQMENAVFRAVVLCDTDMLGVADFPQIAQLCGLTMARTEPSATAPSGLVGAPAVPPTSPGMTTPSAAPNGVNGGHLIAADGNIRKLEDVEGDMIRLAIDKYDGQMSEIARRLGIGRSTLYRKVRDLGIDVRSGAE